MNRLKETENFAEDRKSSLSNFIEKLHLMYQEVTVGMDCEKKKKKDQFCGGKTVGRTRKCICNDTFGLNILKV